ncbi:MAG: LysM peptidoglycan-binding domain-containing protein [Victivallales bacterium]|nr:LysM peptidoglycan-binding domain-containing protein [Victivallales bacterium]
MKKTVAIGMMAGITSAMMLMTGCSSKNQPIARIAGADGFLGSRGVVPPPFSSPFQLKNVPTETTDAVQANQVSEMSEPAISEEDSVLGAGRIASVVPPPVDTSVPVQDAVIPQPIGNEVNTAPVIQDLSTGNTTVLPSDQPGDVMTLPGGVQAGELTYTVKKGDTLISIARMYSVRWEDIALLNNLGNGSGIKAGQILTLPANAVLATESTPIAPQPPQNTSPAPVIAPVPPKPAPAKPKTTASSNVTAKPLPADGKYVVMGGDSLWKIAHKYGLSVDSIRSMNNLKSDRLTIGQVLILRKDSTTEPQAAPAPKEKKTTSSTSKPAASTGLSADKHIVVSGDNLWTLARKYKVSDKDLWKWNNLKSSNLRIGQVLIVKKPANATETPAEFGIPSDVPAVNDNQAAAVPPEQTTTPEAAAATPEPTTVTPGAVIDLTTNQDTTEITTALIPGTAETSNKKIKFYPHIVKEGETLPDILSAYSITKETFMQHNPTYKEGDELKAGSEVMVPYDE